MVRRAIALALIQEQADIEFEAVLRRLADAPDETLALAALAALQRRENEAYAKQLIEGLPANNPVLAATMMRAILSMLHPELVTAPGERLGLLAKLQVVAPKLVTAAYEQLSHRRRQATP